MQLAKKLSHLGLFSRRKAKETIKSGLVKVNNEVIENPLYKVSKDDVIFYNNQIFKGGDASDIRVWKYYKPTGVISSHNDPQGRPTVFSSLPKNLPRVISVGRLDLNSEGLLLLTNNGDLARFLELPSNQIIRVYQVRVYGKLNAEDFDRLKNGCMVDGVRYAGIKVRILSIGSKNHWLQILLNEGKNREIRKIMNSIGLMVNKLIRIRYGPFFLQNVKRGELVEISKDEVNNFLKNKDYYQ